MKECLAPAASLYGSQALLLATPPPKLRPAPQDKTAENRIQKKRTE